jgi:hypothetical protein
LSNPDILVVRVKNAIKVSGDQDDEFHLEWEDLNPHLEKMFALNFAQRFTPINIKTQLNENEINLKDNWLILDEFICS